MVQSLNARGDINWLRNSGHQPDVFRALWRRRGTLAALKKLFNSPTSGKPRSIAISESAQRKIIAVF
jgi:hypothetical protein